MNHESGQDSADLSRLARARLLAELILENSPRKSPLRILSVGESRGHLTICLSAEGHNVTAISPEDEVVERMRENAAREVSEADFIAMDAKSLDFRDSVYDIAVASNLLGRMDGSELALAEMRRTMKRTSRLFVVDAAPGEGFLLEICALLREGGFSEPARIDCAFEPGTLLLASDRTSA